jgi:hypothetical protein
MKSAKASVYFDNGIFSGVASVYGLLINDCVEIKSTTFKNLHNYSGSSLAPVDYDNLSPTEKKMIDDLVWGEVEDDWIFSDITEDPMDVYKRSIE